MARVAVVGVGAVGTAMAAAVQQAGGHELVLCARRPVDGLSLQSSDGWTIDIVAPVVTEPDQLAPADWVLLAVKTYQARSTEGWLRRLCGAETTVVVLQNGIEQRESVRGLVSDGATSWPERSFRPSRPWTSEQRPGESSPSTRSPAWRRSRDGTRACSASTR